MPRGDGTGPAGLGSRTGRGLGFCAGYDTPGFTKGPGAGMAWGFGRRGLYSPGRGLALGRGGRWGGGGGRAGIFYAGPGYNMPAPQITEEQKLALLKQDKEYLEAELKGLHGALEDIMKKIKDLEGSQ